MHVDCVATAQLHCFVREGGVRVGLLALIVSAPCVAGCGSLNNVCAHTLCVFLCVCVCVGGYIYQRMRSAYPNTPPTWWVLVRF